MTSISTEIIRYQTELERSGAQLVAVSKTKPIPQLMEAYEAGQRDFGENKVQELVTKVTQMPTDTRWHMIGHLQRNKVKLIAPFIHLIHSIDSTRLLDEIEKEATKAKRVISILLQVHIASESEKYGFSSQELLDFLASDKIHLYKSIKIEGLMGMATFTDDEAIINSEFGHLRHLFDQIKQMSTPEFVTMTQLSMGMSGDYPIALKNGATLVRIGSSIFGSRNYS